MKKIMKKALCLMLVLALAIVPMTVMAADGDSSNPISVTNGGTVTVASGAKVYYTSQVMGAAMMGGICDVTVTGNTGFTIYGIPSEMAIGMGETSVPDTEGTATVSSFTGGMMSMLFGGGKTLFAIENTSGSEQTYTVKAELPKGTMDNPEVVEFQVNAWSGAYGAYVSKDLTEGSQGYYYTCTAPADGAISVNVSSMDPVTYMDMGWTYCVNNITAGKYGDNHWSDDTEIVNPEMVPVSKDDVLIIFVNTYDANNPYGAAPAATVGVNMGFYSLGDAEYPDTAVLGENTANVKAGTWGYNYTYTATEAGTIKVMIDSSTAAGWQFNVNNLTTFAYGDPHTSTDVPLVSSDEVAVSVGDELQIVVNTFDEANPWQAPAGTIKWTLSYTDGSGNQGGGNQGGGEQGGGNQGDETNYEEMNISLLVGTNQYTASNMYPYSVYTFEPTEDGKYTFTTTDGTLIGIVSANGMWITVEPSATTVTETSIEWECSSVGQSVWLAALPATNVAEITITREALAPSNEVPWTIYDNKVTVDAFTFEDSAEDLLYVDIEDAVEDKAVLGNDGYYHLNSVDGPILYVDLDDTTYMDLVSAMGYGQLKEIVYENGEVVSKVDYNDAFAEYIAVADANTGLYPLTEDLMTIYQNVGESQGWYMDGGWVGSTPDAWMFACYYVEGSSSEGGNTTGGATDGSTTGGTTGGSTTAKPSPSTGDNASVAVWAIVMVVAAGAAFVVAESKRRAR